MTENKRSLFIRAVGIAGTLVVFGMTFSGATPAPKLYPGKITIGVVVWPGYEGLYVAKAKGFFKEAGLDVEIRNYPGLADLSKDYVAKNIQARANITIDTVKEALGGFDHKVVLVIDHSNGADGILTRKDIASVESFKGKRVSYEIGTLEEFFLSWALQEKGLELSDITTINGTPEDAPGMLKEGKVDVAVSYEPFLSKLASSSDEFHIVYSSKDAPGLIADILTFRADFIEKYPETVQAVIDAYFKALDYSKAHPDEAHAITARELGDTADSVVEQLKGLSILSKRDNEVAFTFSAGIRSLYGNLRQVRKFVDRHAEVNIHPLDTDSLIENRFIRVAAETQGG